MRKALLGAKVRRLRQDRELTQTAMAEKLGISPSYLNLIEHDQRPVTVGLLLKLGETLGVDLRELSDDAERRLAATLAEVFADPELGAGGVGAEEVRRLVSAAPNAGQVVGRLYRAWRLAREDAAAVSIDLPGGRTAKVALPAEEARDFFEARGNHFPAIEEAAEALATELGAPTGDPASDLAERLASRHHLAVEIAPAAVMQGARRRYDADTRRLILSEVLPRSSRRFHLAYQLGLLEAREAIEGTLRAGRLTTAEGNNLCRVGLANYFAGAVLMPYGPFLASARETRHDIALLTRRFDVSFEQAAHRLATLQKPGDPGIPFFFVRADIAGNVRKRFSAGGFHFSRFGGACARFVLYEAFAAPGLVRTQVARMPDGSRFFCFAQTVETMAGGYRSPASRYAIGLGCDIGRAAELVYADGLDLEHEEAVTDIGPGCRLCERTDCPQRAFPPLHHRLLVDERVKGASPYAFTAARGAALPE
jgi:predicted transcriptional regulator/transcriptional regulator with XRE-family HTH domain